MKQEELAALTNDELLKEAKKTKTNSIYDAAIIGFLIGVSVYSTVKNGAGLLSFLPLVYIPIAVKNKAKNNTIKKLMKERGLQ